MRQFFYVPTTYSGGNKHDHSKILSLNKVALHVKACYSEFSKLQEINVEGKITVSVRQFL